MAELTAADAAAAAETILPIIKRAAPEAIERAELVDQCGLETDEIRAGLAHLLDGDAIREEGAGFALASSAPSAAPSADEAAGEEGEGAPETADPASPASVPGAGQNYRATFDVTLTFGEKKDDAALQAAAAIEEEIADLVHERYPNAVVSVDVSKVEAYKPRVIFGEGAEAAD